MLVKPEDEETCVKLSNKESLKTFFDEHFPMFVPWIKDEDVESMANSKFFGLPSFGYVDKSLNMGGQGALLGDAIHTVKPYFGLGVNSAWEDVKVLVEALDDADGDTSVALPQYSKKRAADAKALVDLSRSFDGGFMTFVLPLIVDSIFNKVAPWLFMPNTIQMLQREGMVVQRDRQAQMARPFHARHGHCVFHERSRVRRVATDETIRLAVRRSSACAWRRISKTDVASLIMQVISCCVL